MTIPNLMENLTLRDYFAAQAMSALVEGLVADEAQETLVQLASDAYAIADAMLAERVKGGAA